MANTRKEVLKLIRAIPATLGVRDHATKRVLDALKEVVEHLLLEMYGKPGEEATPAFQGLTELEAGQNITIEKKAAGVRRITSRDTGISWEDALAAARQVAGDAEAGIEPPEDPGAAVVTIGDTTEGAEAAEGTTWTYAGVNGLKLYAMTRVAYYDAGDKILYGYVRLLTFDKYGRLYSTGAETRVSIDVTVPES